MSSQEKHIPHVMERPHYSDDEIDLRELFAILWRGKWIITLFVIIFASAGVFYALSKPNIYQSSVLLAPAQDEGGSGISGQLGGLASLAGISLGGGGSNQTVIAKEVLQSRAFLTDFIHRHNLIIPLMATDTWDVENEKWLIDREVYNPETGEWLTNDEGESLEPTDWDMVKQFKQSHLSLSTNEDIGMLTLSIKSQAPPVAKEWAEKLVHDINEHMRAQDVDEAETRIAYLERKLGETNIAGMQQVFYQLIESETRTVMLANAQSEYIFKTLDPAVIPQEKSEPKRALIAIVATMLGGMLGVFTVILVAFIRSGKEGFSEG
ncbi:Wzz/FepE/Etk N-terminal domain-containing protein [Marinobacter sp. 1_MG-2023]|uniref:Wzz/FepE/Etk N-terminal domain-containing protein n=1 Tax=Marinobacter sp. 1_MG-2023 TaxID=3062627 RepID=UPI0026E15B8A|nr:Wzz/FepE/Etk N-terminal domain-containing protein [Marinobacter sp. 1_MG-2023]MDO6823295.1 Wzz/FepE/Etk N-terminal domain-containing protein [Marinobacter sp. 1_MG-2023]